MAEAKSNRRSSAVMIVAVVLLGVLTAALGALAIHGFFVTGWLLPYWNAMTDAQASIISQLIFFLAVAWGSLLVPLLFGGQLKSLEEAADKAQETYDGIKRQLEESASESRRQFSSISRYQQMSLGYFASEGVFTDLDDEQKKAFVENAWHSVESKLTDALNKLHGRTRQWVSAGGKYRSTPWWDRVKESKALGDWCSDFRIISDAKWAASRGTVPTFEQLKAVNDALKELQEFVSPLDAEAGVPAIQGNAQPNGSAQTPDASATQ
ncbi:MAG: hypothetical protein IPG56_02020 [Caulobacteraceae bacterium]|nr:hypothetical protein [Caulobacteraceae bacterium]